MSTRLTSLRASASQTILPRRLLLVRHGESEANVNREVYSKVPDWRIPLTANGRAQAFDCGKRLRRLIGDEKLYIYYSPYLRARQSLDEIRRSLLPAQIQGEREDERLREQEMGNFQPMEQMDATWSERNSFSRLYYRFPGGESSADVGDRVSGFFDSLFRERKELAAPTLTQDQDDDATLCQQEDQNVLIVSHGLLIRLFIGTWFKVPMEVFETMRNPPNCSIVVMQRDDALGKLIMTDVSKKLLGSDPLLEMMRFDGDDSIAWYRNLFLKVGYENLDIPRGALDLPPSPPRGSFSGKDSRSP